MPCAVHAIGPDAKDKDDELDLGADRFHNELERLATSFFMGQDLLIDEQLLKLIAEKLKAAVSLGFGSPDYKTPSWEMLRRLQSDIYVFSGFKTYHQLREISGFLIDPATGLKREFVDFKKQVLKVSEEYNVRYLKAEYQHAIGSARMAQNWQNATAANPDALLQYETIGDGRVREEHRRLNRITRPASDSFWATYYPPNGWGCRCDVREVADGSKQTEKLPDNLPALDDMFKVNTAQKGVIFPAKHPYYSVSRADKPKIKEVVNKILKNAGY